MAGNDESLTDLLDTLDTLAENEDDVTVGDVTDALGGRGFGPLMMLPALLVVTPLGGIPGFPTLMAVMIFLIAVQLILQRDALWLPGFIKQRGVTDDKLARSVDRLRGPGRWIDDHFGDNLQQLTGPPVPSIAAGLIALLCALVPPSEVIPFAAILPMLGIAVLGLALTLKDGALMAAGFALAGTGLVAVLFWLT